MLVKRILTFIERRQWDDALIGVCCLARHCDASSQEHKETYGEESETCHDFVAQTSEYSWRIIDGPFRLQRTDDRTTTRTGDGKKTRRAEEIHHTRGLSQFSAVSKCMRVWSSSACGCRALQMTRTISRLEHTANSNAIVSTRSSHTPRHLKWKVQHFLLIAAQRRERACHCSKNFPRTPASKQVRQRSTPSRLLSLILTDSSPRVAQNIF